MKQINQNNKVQIKNTDNNANIMSKGKKTKIVPHQSSTIAELNKISIKQSKPKYHLNYPLRVQLPQYFNIPSFEDQQLISVANYDSLVQNRKVSIVNKEDISFKKRIKDISILAEGMKRSKNIKQQSRYYFMQAVLYHNVKNFQKQIQMIQKFLKIVIYLKDQKSIQLGLNVIGCSYMQQGQFKKAIQAHARQEQVSIRSDKWISYSNIGICHELLGNHRTAYQVYQQAEKVLDLNLIQNPNQSQVRAEITQKLIQRVSGKTGQQYAFMTENSQKQQKIQDKKQKGSTQKNQTNQNRSILNSLLKQQSSLMLKKATHKKQYEQNKLKYAIYAAQQNINQHLQSALKFQY